MSDFHDLIATEKLFNKKTCFLQKLSKTLRNNHLKIADITKTAKKHKTEKRSKTSKTAKSTENRFEVILVSNKVNILNGKVSLPKLSKNLSNQIKLAQNGPTRPNCTKTKTRQKRSKLLKNDFCKLKAKKSLCNINFTQSFPETFHITLILQENKHYGQTTQKPKIGQKVKNTENKTVSKHC